MKCIETIDIIGKNYSLVKYYDHTHILRRRITGIGEGNEAMLELGKVANVEIAKFVHAEELAFHIRNRRNKQLGLWLAAELALIEDALDYAKTIVTVGIAEPDDEFLIQHFQQDLARRGVRLSEAAIRCELERKTELAVRECTLLQPSTVGRS